MVIDTPKQATESLLSLNKSVWIFSALNVIAETGALAAMREKVSLDTLVHITHLPVAALTHTLRMLEGEGFVISERENYQLAPGLIKYIEQAGLESVIAQFRVVFGTTREFVHASRERTLQLGWTHTDERILQSQGLLSECVANDFVPQNKQLVKLISQPGAKFLDVGAGVGRISIRLCQLYETLRIVALEPADKPFSLAAQNIKSSGFSERIELRKTYVEALQDNGTFDGIWFPHIFISEEVLTAGLAAVWRALKPGGILLTSMPSDQPGPFAHIRRLMVALFGGLRPTDAVVAALENAGFTDIQIFPEIVGYSPVTATKLS